MKEGFIIDRNKNIYNELMQIPREQFLDFARIVDEVFTEKERLFKMNKCDICKTPLKYVSNGCEGAFSADLVCPNCIRY